MDHEMGMEKREKIEKKITHKKVDGEYIHVDDDCV